MTTPAPSQPALLQRADFAVPSEPGIEIFVREVQVDASEPYSGVPLLLIHGGGPGGLASFDLPVPGYSLAADLAMAGHAVYVMDVRGWGGSTRPPALDQPAAANPPAVSSEEAERDIGAVVAWIRDGHEDAPVALFGWATGGHWAGMYATRQPDAVAKLVILNSLYGVDAPWGLRPAFEAADRPGEFDRTVGAYGLRNAQSLLASWDRTIPVADKTVWRDPRVANAYVREALASDPTSATREPPSLRIPTGFQRESFEMSLGRKLWDAADIHAPTLVLRGERDFWSRPDDLIALRRELIHAPSVRAVTIPDATHYLFNDRPERGRARLLAEVTAFLAGVSGAH